MSRGIEGAILETLAEHDQLSVPRIAETLDRHPVTIDRQCYDLQGDGYIVIASSGGTYKLTDEGRSRLEGTDEEGV